MFCSVDLGDNPCTEEFLVNWKIDRVLVSFLSL